jgi:phosphoglycerate dehydrogenase-like enzyme
MERALDTMEIEPPILAVHGSFLKHDNVILTPHIGRSTKVNQSRNGMYMVEMLVNVLRGREATEKLV